jgi:photosystem II stability/assembly factor-like uncharacterized protein
MRRRLKLFVSCLFAFAAATFVLAAGKDSSRWTVQTSGIDTNLRGVSVGVYENSHNVVTPVVWASGSNGVILQSKDLGKTWKRLHVADGEALDFRSIQAFDDRKAYVMSSGDGDKSRIYKTTDGGATWALQYTDPRKGFFLDALVCTSQIECRALGDPIDGKFVILRTRDGENWEQLATDKMPEALADEGAFAASGSCLAIYSYQDVYFVTGGPAARLFHSGDGGYSWTVNPTPLASGNASSGIFSVIAHENELVAVGGDYREPSNTNRVAAYSADKGRTWKLAERQPGGYRSAVARIDERSLVAVGPNGEDVSDDGGAHWTHTDSLNLNALNVLRYDYAWAVGPNGTVARLKSSPIYVLH